MVIRASDFELIPDDLLSAVVHYGSWLEAQGYRVTVEPVDLGYPNTPVFRAHRQAGEAFFYEVASKVNLARAEEWVKFGRASQSDTRYIVGIATDKAVLPATLTRLTALGVGVDVITGSSVTSLVSPHDLSLNVEFPALARSLQKALGKARDLWGQGNWKESYEDACLAVETIARQYLKRAVKSGRVSFVSVKGKPIRRTEAQVGKMTLGELAIAFAEITGPTQTESQVAVGLARINPRRVTVAHFKHTKGKRARQLRDEVGRDLNVIVNCITLLRS
ncbi:hypothetical protein [Leucobacter celer]|uniref:hypothetical protein n=1 Tax=Leucobacter celer TaxID=668625 RepID=UPI000B222A83|nr:hypothetical protein [Leucobacter celer]